MHVLIKNQNVAIMASVCHEDYKQVTMKDKVIKKKTKKTKAKALAK